MLRTILCACLLCQSLWSALPAGAEDDTAFVETRAFGSIDWQAGIAVARGIGTPTQNQADQSSHASTARVLADAKYNARKALMQIIASIPVDADLNVAAMTVAYPDLKPRLEIMIQAAREIEARRRYLFDGMIESYLEFPLSGEFAQLMLPGEFNQIQPITPVQPSVAETGRQAPQATAHSESYTGLIIDARKLAVNPALAPRIFDNHGREVYGASFASREYAVQKGVVAYVTTPTGAGIRIRVGDAPLVARALQVVGNNRCDMVISNADADKLRSGSSNLEFMRKCKVVVIVDPSDG